MSFDLQGVLEVVRREALRILSKKSFSRKGTVEAYDPLTYQAKVLIQPEEILTGYLPIGAEFVGPGWGLLFGPAVGDTVEVTFDDGNFNAGHIGKRFYSNLVPPPQGVLSGEVWLVNQSGTAIKLVGTTMTVVATNIVLQGTVQVQGNLSSTGNISDSVRSMAADRAIYDGHNHNLPGGGTSLTPNQQQ